MPRAGHTPAALSAPGRCNGSRLFLAAVALFTGAMPLTHWPRTLDRLLGATNPLKHRPECAARCRHLQGRSRRRLRDQCQRQFYGKLYPDSEITYAGIQGLGAQLQPRFVDGSPPDVIDNSGAGNLDTAALVAEGQLADLADLMAAPSYDTEGKTFAETLVPGSQDSGIFDGKQLCLNWALTVVGVWYSSTWMESKGYAYPTTWTEFIASARRSRARACAPSGTDRRVPAVHQELHVRSDAVQARSGCRDRDRQPRAGCLEVAGGYGRAYGA